MGNVTRINLVKVHYLGDFEEPFIFMGVATKTPYKFGGRINLGEVDARDLSIGRSTRPGLLELTDGKGQKLFELWTPLQEQKEAEARTQEAQEAAEALAVPEGPKKSKAKRKLAAEPTNGKDPLPAD